MKPTPNEQQLECINTLDGKILALCGPGTGKTFTVIQRLEHMLESGVAPEKILCLTFTDAAVEELKDRLNQDVGSIASKVDIFTYHGFCNQIIQDYQSDFHISNIKVITETIARSFVKDVIEEFRPEAYRTDRNDPYFYVKKIKEQIDDIKKNRLTKEQFFENLKNNSEYEPALFELKQELALKQAEGKTKTKTLEDKIKNLEKNIKQFHELWDIYEAYQKKMTTKHYVDFNDMISMVLDKFETSPAFLERIASRYEYLQVDEYQDTNSAQNAIIFNLAHVLNNVFVVGDDDQIIYSFQGAHLDTMENFLTEFPDTKVICFTENRRSTQSILDASRLVATQDGRRLEANEKFKEYHISKKLVAKNDDINALDKPVQLRTYQEKQQEYTAIVDEIEQLINSDQCPKDKEGNKALYEISILAKTNEELEDFADLFRARSIPYELKNGRNIFEIPSVQVLFAYLQAMTDPILYGYRLFQILLSQPFHINPYDYSLLKDRCTKTKNCFDVFHELDKYSDWKDKEKLQKFINVYDHLCEYANCENIKNTVLEIATKTGIIAYYLNSEINKAENVAGLAKLTQEAEDYMSLYPASTLPEFVTYLTEILESDTEKIVIDKAPISNNAVQLVTYYCSKGREFAYVYMPSMTSDKWESSSKSNKSNVPLAEESNDELRKILKNSDNIKVIYVGMTRAKHCLRISWASCVDGKAKNMSDYITNILDNLQCEHVDEYTNAKFADDQLKSLEHREYDYRREFNAMIDKYIANQVFSVSNINSYIACPRKYLYENILGFKGKSSDPDAASFGTAMHAAYEFAIKTAKQTGSFPPVEDVLKEFTEVLNQQPVSSVHQRQNLLERAKKALENGYNIVCGMSIEGLYETEYKIYEVLDGMKFIGFIL